MLRVAGRRLSSALTWRPAAGGLPSTTTTTAGSDSPSTLPYSPPPEVCAAVALLALGPIWAPLDDWRVD
jgi:hypothetical protein